MFLSDIFLLYKIRSPDADWIGLLTGRTFMHFLISRCTASIGSANSEMGGMYWLFRRSGFSFTCCHCSQRNFGIRKRMQERIFFKIIFAGKSRSLSGIYTPARVNWSDDWKPESSVVSVQRHFRVNGFLVRACFGVLFFPPFLTRFLVAKMSLTNLWLRHQVFRQLLRPIHLCICRHSTAYFWYLYVAVFSLFYRFTNVSSQEDHRAAVAAQQKQN